MAPTYPDPQRHPPAGTEVYDLIYRHARAAGLALAHPKEVAGVSAGLSQAAAPAAPKATALRLLDALPLLASLTESLCPLPRDQLSLPLYGAQKVRGRQRAFSVAMAPENSIYGSE
jgi:hypothetical protein